MDFANITFYGLVAVGFVNVITFFNPRLTQTGKFILSFIAVFALTFVPMELQNILLDKIKTAIEIAFAVSGTYKIATKMGGY